MRASSGDRRLQRLVVHNSGPGIAVDVQLSLYAAEPSDHRIHGLELDVIPELPAGVDFHIAFEPSYGDEPDKVVVVWTTGRRLRSVRELPL